MSTKWKNRIYIGLDTIIRLLAAWWRRKRT